MHHYKWLAIETSTDTLSIAVADSHGETTQVWTFTGEGGAQASHNLLPAIADLMEAAQIRLADLTAVVFGKGPGSFTGLRTACAVAQGLAFGAGIAVLPIDTLLAVAEDARVRDALPSLGHASTQTHRYVVAMDARMDQVYSAAYVWQPPQATNLAHWQCVQPPAVHAPEDMAMPADLQGLRVVCAGNAGKLLAGRWPDACTHSVLAAMPTAEALLRLAPAAWLQGLALPPEEALPVYIRDKVAQTTQERALQQLAKAMVL